MTLEKAREAGLDCFFFLTEESRTQFLASTHRVTGRETGTFDETVAGFTLLVGTVTPRPRPVVRIVEAPV